MECRHCLSSLLCEWISRRSPSKESNQFFIVYSTLIDWRNTPIIFLFWLSCCKNETSQRRFAFVVRRWCPAATGDNTALKHTLLWWMQPKTKNETVWISRYFEAHLRHITTEKQPNWSIWMLRVPYVFEFIHKTCKNMSVVLNTYIAT